MVEAVIHNFGTRITIIYYGLGAFTFPLRFDGNDSQLMYHTPYSDAQFVKYNNALYVQGNMKVTVRDEEDGENSAGEQLELPAH